MTFQLRDLGIQEIYLKTPGKAGHDGSMPIIPVLGRLRQKDSHECGGKTVLQSKTFVPNKWAVNTLLTLTSCSAKFS